MHQNLTFFQQLFSIKILTKLSYWVYIFLEPFLNIAKMPKKPFSLRSVQCTHIKYAKKMKRFDSFTKIVKIRFLVRKLQSTK